MVEASLRAAIRYGLEEAEFWSLTPYRLRMRLQEVGKGRSEVALLTGWFAERFAREDSLRGPQHYIEDFLGSGSGGNAEVQQQMAEAELNRMALTWGLDLEDIEEEPADG